MTGKARGRRTTSGILGRNKDDINKLFNVRTRNKIVTPTQVTLPSGTTNTGTQGNYLPLSGGTMNGIIGGAALALTIDTGDLDLTVDNVGNEAIEFPIIFVTPESGTTDTLDTITISNSFPVGGRILLVGVSGNSITVSASGTTSGLTKGIMIDGNSPQELGSTEVMELFYDIVSDKFHVIGAGLDKIISGDSEVFVADGSPSTIYFTLDNTDYYWMTPTSFKLINAGSKIDLDGKDIISSSTGSEIGSFTIPITSMYSTDYQVYDTASVPNIDFWKDDSTPNDDDIIGLINFYGENSSGTKTPFAAISATMQDVTAATEDSSLEISLYTAGNTADRFILDGQSKTVQLYDGWAYKAIGTTEIGFQVTNGSLTVGSKGSIEAPYLAQTDTPTDATLDGFFGNTDGCMGFWRDVDSDANSRGFVRMNSVWYYWFLANL